MGCFDQCQDHIRQTVKNLTSNPLNVSTRWIGMDKYSAVSATGTSNYKLNTHIIGGRFT